MGRQHIHFVENLPSGQTPISGMRSSCQVVVYVDIKKALKGKIDTSLTLIDFDLLIIVVSQRWSQILSFSERCHSE